MLVDLLARVCLRWVGIRLLWLRTILTLYLSYYHLSISFYLSIPSLFSSLSSLLPSPLLPSIDQQQQTRSTRLCSPIPITALRSCTEYNNNSISNYCNQSITILLSIPSPLQAPSNGSLLLQCLGHRCCWQHCCDKGGGSTLSLSMGDFTSDCSVYADVIFYLFSLSLSSCFIRLLPKSPAAKS